MMVLIVCINNWKRCKVRDSATPTSQSVLWRWATHAYSTWSWDKWNTIPHKVTNSTWLVDRFQDMIGHMYTKTEKKIVVIEWGCGCGAFAYRMLRATTQDIVHHYICCDLQENMPNMLSGHPQLKEYYKAGRVSFYVGNFTAYDKWYDDICARFPVEEYTYIIICNYMVDALPTDVWYVSPQEAPVPLTMVAEAEGRKDWLSRNLQDVHFTLDHGDAWQPQEQWYHNLISRMQPMDGSSAVYNVPVVCIDVCRGLRRKYPACMIIVTDIPLYRMPLEGIESPYFIDGMVASVFDFEVFGWAMADDGVDVWQDGYTPGIELQMAVYSWGVLPYTARHFLTLPSFSIIMQNIQKADNALSLVDALGYLDFCKDDPWLLDVLVRQSVGMYVKNASLQKVWVRHIHAMSDNVYWMPESKDLLDVATLYRWQKEFEPACAALKLYAQLQGYDYAYWYCIGYWLYDQRRFYDALDAWDNTIVRNKDFKDVLADDIANAQKMLSEE